MHFWSTFGSLRGIFHLCSSLISYSMSSDGVRIYAITVPHTRTVIIIIAWKVFQRFKWYSETFVPVCPARLAHLWPACRPNDSRFECHTPNKAVAHIFSETAPQIFGSKKFVHQNVQGIINAGASMLGRQQGHAKFTAGIEM